MLTAPPAAPPGPATTDPATTDPGPTVLPFPAAPAVRRAAPVSTAGRRHAVGGRLTASQRAVERVLKAAAARNTRQLERAGRDPRATQLGLLRTLLKRAGRSDFGRDHGLRAVRRTRGDGVVDAVRSAVPVRDYAGHRAYVEAVMNGRPRALFAPGERVRMFALTSGTTAARKHLPVTARAARNHRRGWMVWGLAAYAGDPPLLSRGKLALAGDPAESLAPDGTPCGSISGLLADIQSPLVRRGYTAPPECGRLTAEGPGTDKTAAKYYLQWRFGLHSDVGSFVTPNPATHLAFAKWGAANAEMLLDHHAAGGLPAECARPGGVLAGVTLPAAVTRAAGRHLPADPAGASVLRELTRGGDPLRPADAWPHLDLIGCWTGGTLGHYLPLLSDWYDARVRDIGLIASEGRTTIPTADDTPAGRLDLSAAFFEFVPEADIDRPDPPALLCDELTAGESYYVLMTTPGGLWRYDIRDVVRCEGYASVGGRRARGPGVPRLSFLSKGARFSSVCGEKLSEHQAAAAVSAALARCGGRVGGYLLAPEFRGGRPGYVLLHEPPNGLPGGSSDAAAWAVRWAAAVDHALSEGNCEYAAKRATGRLGPVVPRLVPPTGWAEYDARRLAAAGGVPEQYKRPVLSGDYETAAGLTASVLPGGRARAAV